MSRAGSYLPLLHACSSLGFSGSSRASVSADLSNARADHIMSSFASSRDRPAMSHSQISASMPAAASAETQGIISDINSGLMKIPGVPHLAELASGANRSVLDFIEAGRNAGRPLPCYSGGITDAKFRGESA